MHTVDIAAYAKLDGTRHVGIGGFESGADAAVHLAAAGREVVVLDRGGRWEERDSDPSRVLSPFTLDRLEAAMETGLVELVSGVDVAAVEADCDGPPVLATGFASGLGLVHHLFRGLGRARSCEPADDGDIWATVEVRLPEGW